MSFLYPTFLWALVALTIPVIIHLFNFRKTTRVYFSNTRFLKQVKEVTTARRRLKHYLILASRLLFLTFLIVAFAQPVIPAREQLNAHRNITIYLDNSLSMSAQLEDKLRALDAGIGFVQTIIDLFPQDTRYKLITNDFSPFSNTYKTKLEITDLLTQVRLSPVTRGAQEIVTRVSQDNKVTGGRDIFWISDFQKSTFGHLATTEFDSADLWHLVPLSPDISDNVFIDSVFLENPFAVGQEKNALFVRIRNDGKKDVEQLNLKLTINNVQAAATSVAIPSGGIIETKFDLASGLLGLNKAHLRFNDSPISFDNDFFAALNFTNKINVMEIKPSAGVTPVERVFGNRLIFNYNGYSVSNFNYSLLNQADLVIVNGIDKLDESLILALNSYLSNYGTLFVIPGSKIDLQSYRKLTNLSLTTTDQQTLQELDRPDFNNPFFENVFEERSTSLAMPSATRLVDWGNDRAAILQFKNGQPFLSMFQQSGKLFLMACSLEDSYTDFSRNAMFVPVMYKMASSAKTDVMKPYYTLDENFVSLKIDSLVGEEPLRLIGQQEVIPAQRQIGDRVLLDLPKFSITQGFYNVVMQQDTVDLLAFNLRKEESLMARYSMDEVKSILSKIPEVSVFESGSVDAFNREIKDRYLGKPLWKYALMLALFFLLMEVLLIRFLR